MHYMLIGCGHVGPAIVRCLIDSDNTQAIHVIDNDDGKLQSMMKKFLQHPNITKVKTHHWSTSNDNILSLLPDIDAIMMAIPWNQTFNLIKKIISFNIPMVSITRPNDADLEELYQIVSKTNISVIVGCGLEPGLTEIVAHYLVHTFPETEELNIYCGGITTVSNPPVYYKQVFGHEIPISPRHAYRFKSGKLEPIARFSEVEKIQLKNIGILEAWHDGMTPWLIDQLDLTRLKNINQKTLRWAGFSTMLSLLQQLGFTTKSPLTINQQTIIPYQMTQQLLQQHSYFDHHHDRDRVILYMKGISANRSIFNMMLQGDYDETFNLTAMACVTGYTATIATKLLVEKKIRGLIHPQQLFRKDNYKLLMNNLTDYGIKIHLHEESL